jgi:hypothetical protein
MKKKRKMKHKLPPHNMIVIHQIGLDLYSLSYVKYMEHDVVQYVKHDLNAEDIAQFLGNN